MFLYFYLEFTKTFLTMKKEEYYSPLVSTVELEREGSLCASPYDYSGLPGSDFDGSTIHDGGKY